MRLVARRLVALFAAAFYLGLLAAIAPGCQSRPQSRPAAPPASSAAPASPAVEQSAHVPPAAAQPSTQVPPPPLPALDAVERHLGGAIAGQPAPLLVAIHGLGDRPEAFVRLVESLDTPAHVVVPAGFDPWGPGRSWFDIRQGDAARAAGIAAAADRLAEWLAARRQQADVKGPVVVTGFSQGGMLSFAIAVRHPSLVDAALPIAGMLPDSLLPQSPAAASRPQIIDFHGTADTRVPYDAGKSTVEQLQARGWDAELRSFEGVGHQIPPAVRTAWAAALRTALTDPPSVAR